MGIAGDVNTSAGSALYIGTQLLNPLVDVYAVIAEVTNLGEFGRVYDEVTYSNLRDRNVRKFKGQRNDGSMNLELGKAGSVVDPGQAALKIALDVDDDYNFKCTLNDDSEVSGATPTTFYFKAKVMSYVNNPGGVNQVVAARSTLGIKSGSITEVGPS